MNLTECHHGPVLHVAANMRALDREEIYALRWEDNPFQIMNDVMARREFAWVAWAGETPCAVIGGAPLHPGVWQMFMFATDEFPRIGLAMTRFVARSMLPALFEGRCAHRLQADSHVNHHVAHRWLEGFGAKCESVRKSFGRDGSDFRHYVLRPVDFGERTGA